ncbi:MAG: glucose-6-phosphate isomerase [Verrucomicrobiaceae bacterium]|nr:glucose-6-phosphate isomerase [Verrucomicrobiaceae bacterium]
MAELLQRFATHQQLLDASPLLNLFTTEPDRARKFSLYAADLSLDFSKHLCNAETLKLFDELAASTQLRAHIEDLFNGAIVNRTEQRPALHTSLRSDAASAPKHDEVAAAQQQMQTLVNALHAQQLQGFSGLPFTDVVNIGIGGSDLGPRFVTTALRHFWNTSVRVHFVANVDPDELTDTLANLNPATTLIITASKSFNTLETLTNTQAARHWLQTAAGEHNVDAHFIAITSNSAKAVAFGIPQSQVFPMWDWVGGRYSLWSAIGLPIAIAVGWDNFHALLQGAAAMDTHYREASFTENMPALLAALEWWYSNYWHAHSALVLPYSHRLRLFPAFLQQLSMESLGKSVDVNGNSVTTHTGLVVWGEPGTNGQHSFMQLLHQGTRFIPVDFIAVAHGESSGDVRQAHLFANCLSQSRALMTGKSLAQVQLELAAAGVDAAEAQALAPHKVHPGNRPSSTILLESLTPARLGALLALYEHKVHALSVFWNINAFDQWGVELGKQSASVIFNAIKTQPDAELDGSTLQLIGDYKSANQ